MSRGLRWGTGWVAWLFLALGLASMATARAQSEFHTFDIDGQSVVLERVEPAADAFFRAFRPNAGSGRWEVDVVVTNGTRRLLGRPLVLRFERAEAVQPGISGTRVDAAGKPYLVLSPLVPAGGFEPGTSLRAFTLSLGDGVVRPELGVALYALPTARTLGVVRVLTADGVPFEEAEVEEIGPVPPLRKRTGRGGWVSLEARAGVVGWRFLASGMEPVVRTVEALARGGVTEVRTVRLVPLLSGAAFPMQAFPAPLPPGWSPLVQFRGGPGGRMIDLDEVLPVGRGAVLARWDEGTFQWRLVGTLAGAGLRRVEVVPAEAGLHAVLMPDAGPEGPVLPDVGGVLAGPVRREVPAGLTAAATLDPATAAASTDPLRVTAVARVEFRATNGPLASGLELPCEVVEEYRLKDGRRRVLPAYTLRVVAHRPAADADGSLLVARFPVRPFQLLGGEVLSEARIRVEVLPPGAFPGGLIPVEGGQVTAGGVAVRAGMGVLETSEAVWLREPTLGGASDLLPGGVTLVRAFELGVGRLLPGAGLEVDLGTVAPGGNFVLARAVFDGGVHGFQPVARLRSDAAGALSVVEPPTGGLAGVDGGGQYLLLRTAAPEALVEGVARTAAGAPASGLVVQRGPWTALTGADGRYRLLAPAGASALTVLDVERGDAGRVELNVGAGLDPVVAEVGAGVSGPELVAVSPGNGATGVPRVTPVSVTFSRVLNPVTVIAGGVGLLGPDGTPVPASVTLNLAGTTVTILPVNALSPATAYRLQVAATVADLAGRPVEGPRESVFTTVDDTVVRGVAAQVTIHAPGSTNLSEAVLRRIPAHDPARDRDGIVVEGSAGTAEPGQAVILVNETTGETQTVLSDVDGSFVSVVRGTVDDFVSAVLVNANGTRNQIPVTRQRFDDGTIGLFAAGGTIRSTGPGVPVDLIVEPGSVSGKTLFKLESLEPSAFTAMVGGHLPEGALPPVGAFELTEAGDPLTEPADIRVPVKLADMGFPPGPLPTNVSFVVVMPVRMEGRVIHQVVDTATYEADGPEGGHLRTASPPFVGMLVRRLAQLAADAGSSRVTTPRVADNNDNPHKGTTAGFGILPMISRGPMHVGGFVRAISRNEDGTESVSPVAGAVVRVMQVQDEQDGSPVVLDGDLVSFSDDRGNFGFFFRPSDSTLTRALLAIHPRFPFQRPRTGGFAGERLGATVVNAELLFEETPENRQTVSDLSPPVVSAGHEPALPSAGDGLGDGAMVFVVGVDDTLVGPPRLRVTGVQDASGRGLPESEALLTREPADADQPGRKVRQFRLRMRQAGRVTLEAQVADGAGHEDRAQHAVVFGASRPPIPVSDPAERMPLRVAFAWPPAKGTNLPSLEPILLRFNRAISPDDVGPAAANWLMLHGTHTLRRVNVSADRREVTVFYDGPATGPVKLSVGPGLASEDGSGFDQDAGLEGRQAFELEFTQAVGPVVNLDGDTGAGVLFQGRYAYALERRGMEGLLKVLDLVDPTEPEEVQTVKLGYPTAMALIPDHSLPGQAMRPVGTNGLPCDGGDWLAMFTGHANEPKYLQLGRVAGGRVRFGSRLILSGGGTDGEGKASVAEGVSRTESLSQVVKAKWSAPFLGYFELGADVTSIQLVNLAAFRRAELAGGRVAEFSVDRVETGLQRETPGFPGVDANGDGDYCDDGDAWPVPYDDPLRPPGSAFSIAPATRAERYEDFDFDAGLGLVVGISRFVGTNLPPRFATLLASRTTNSLAGAFVNFGAAETPRRVLLLPALSLETTTNRVVRDIAVVTLSTGGDGAMAVLDVTEASAPVLLNRFQVPTGEGTPAGLQLRTDGLLVVATSRSTLLLEPGKLGLGASDGLHPAFVGRVDGTGTGVRDFVADASGINLTHGGATRRYVGTAPKFSFIHFNAPISPGDLARQSPEQVVRFLKSATPVQVAEVSRAGEGTNPPPVVASRHYYVLLDAPGGAADNRGRLPLVLSAVDAAGRPQSELGGTVVPAVVGDDQLQSALITRRMVDLVLTVVNIRRGVGAVANATGALAKVRAALGSAKEAKKAIVRLKAVAEGLLLMPGGFEAQRLTEDPDHPLYNRYLAGPFVILGGAPTLEQLMALRQQASAMELERVYLRPSPRLWVGFPSVAYPGLMQRLNPLAPALTKLPAFVSQLRLNPTLTLAGIEIPFVGDLVEGAAALTVDNPGSPVGSFFDQAQTAAAMVSLLGNVPVVSAILKSEWQPHLSPGAHALLRVNFRERPMLFVPGFAGSKLEVDGKDAWIDLALSDEGRELRSLRVRDDGTPVGESYATDAVRFTIEAIEFQSIYGKWLSELTTELGMTEYDYLKRDGLTAPGGPLIRERLKPGAKALIGQTPVPNLFVFPYDWRLDNAKSAEQLREYVRLALELHPDADGIDLVGHSNGGLVARAYMEMPGQRPLVKRFITVGTPWLGSPKPLAGLRTGDMSEPMINLIAPIPSVRMMLQFAPGVHQLLPTREYFNLGFRPLVEDGYDVDADGDAHAAYTFEQYQEALAGNFLREPVEELLGNGRTIEDIPGGEHPVRRNANGFHVGRRISDHTLDAADVEMHHIFGMGSVPTTIGQLRIRGRLVSRAAQTNVTVSLARVTSRESEQVTDGADLLVTPEDGRLAVDPLRQFGLSEEVEVRYVSGDGTVPVASLARGHGSPVSLNARHARLYPLVGSFADELTGHNPMLNTEEFLGLFRRVYAGLPVTQVTVTAAPDGGFVEGTLGSLTVSGVVPEAGESELGVVVDFGDGGVEMRNTRTGVPVTVQHRYRQSGTYLVTVGAATKEGVHGLTSLQLVVANDPPKVTIQGGDVTVDLGDTRIFVAEVEDKGLDDRHRFSWTAPGGQAQGVNAFAVPVTFDEPGEKTVSVRVSDDADDATASVRVTVRRTPSNRPAANFGLDSARPAARAAGPLLDGFEGGHPELIVRVHGHAPGALGTTGLSVREDGAVGAVASVLLAFDNAGGFAGALERFILPHVARFLGRMASDTEFWRLLRMPTSEVAGVDVALTEAFLGARGRGQPMEVDVLYLEGGIPRVLRRWMVPNVRTNEGVRLHFSWIELDATLDRVLPAEGDGGALNGTVVESLAPRFSVFSEQGAGDRTGPTTVGILNPATDLVTVLGRDNLTPETNLVLFAVFDANENGRLEDDTFYPLDANVVRFARLPKRPFAVVGVDEQGNVGSLDPFRVSETRNYLGRQAAGQGESEYERKLRDIRTAIRATIQEARVSPVIQGRFLLDPADLWVFEQGSGANLWKEDSVRRCNGIYLPGKSDNDYELFLPVRVVGRYGFSEAERLRFEADGPHNRATLDGDWYFRRPSGVDAAGAPTTDDGAIVEWEYALPGGLTVGGTDRFRVPRRDTDENLATGFRSPLTPAEVIAREFVQVLKSDPARAALLPDTSFFPERREHFMFGRLHLQRPPEFGADPIGDAGMGRQMLLMKWLLEGAFVTATDGGGVGDFSPGAPAMTDVYANWKRVGVPRAEGYEWGIFQDFAALKAQPFQVAEMRLSTLDKDRRLRLLQRSIDDAVAQQQASRLKKLGKAAIRATLARLAGDTNLNSIVTGVPDARVTDGSVRSFEHLIRELALGSDTAKAAFGDFAKDRDDLAEPPDIGDFLRAKNGDREYLATIIHHPGSYERFVQATFSFLRTVVQRPTLSPYRDHTGGLLTTGQVDELQQRTSNLNFVLRGDGVGHPGLLVLNADRRVGRMNLPLAVEVYGPEPQDGFRVTRSDGGGDEPGPGTGRRAAAPALDEDPRETGPLTAEADSDNTIDGTEEGEPLFQVEGSAEEDVVDTEFATTRPDGAPIAEDDDVGAAGTRIAGPAVAPVVSDRPEVFLSVMPTGTDRMFILRDHASDGLRERSPAQVLRLTDRLMVFIIAPKGLAGFEATVRMAGATTPPMRVQVTDKDGLGLYTNDGPSDEVRFTNQEPAPAGRLYVQDEAVLEVQVTGPGLDGPVNLDVAIDLGELAMATVQHADRSTAGKPRFDYKDLFLDEPNRIDWASAGFVEFPDDVAKAAFDAGVPGGDNAMRRFIQAFADPALPAVGEADVLYVHTHGGPDGTLGDHVSDGAPGNTLRRLVLDPEVHLSADGRWNRDADWFVSEACAMLFGGLSTTPPPGGSSGLGASIWRDVLRSSPRPPHGILGFAIGKSADRRATRDFLIRLDVGYGYVEAWKAACEAARPQLPWAAIFYNSARGDTVREVSRDPLGGDPMSYDSIVGVPAGLCFDAAACCSGPGSLTLVQPGLWLHSALAGMEVPGTLPASVEVRSRDFLVPGPDRTRRVVRTTEWEEMTAGGRGGLVRMGGAESGAEARAVAEAFLAECGIDTTGLRWNHTAEAVRQTFTGDVVSPPRTLAHVVQHEMVAFGLPVSGSGVTVKVQPEGIARVTVQRVPLPVGPGSARRIQPVRLEDALARHWEARWKAAPGRIVVVGARLCWKLDPIGLGEGTRGKAIPVWEVQWAPADEAGQPVTMPMVHWLEAVQGRELEVSK